MAKTKYIYKGQEISHLDFLQIMREAGIKSGWRVSHYDHLCQLADNGNEKAKAILEDLKIDRMIRP